MKSKAMRGTGDPNLPRPPDDPEQSKRFEEKARELEADDSEDAFERVIGVVVKRNTAPNSSEPLTQKPTPTIVAEKKKRTKK